MFRTVFPFFHCPEQDARYGNLNQPIGDVHITVAYFEMPDAND